MLLELFYLEIEGVAVYLLLCNSQRQFYAIFICIVFVEALCLKSV